MRDIIALMSLGSWPQCRGSTERLAQHFARLHAWEASGDDAACMFPGTGRKTEGMASLVAGTLAGSLLLTSPAPVTHDWVWSASCGTSGMGPPDVMFPRQPPVAGIAEGGGMPAGVTGRDQVHQVA